MTETEDAFNRQTVVKINRRAVIKAMTHLEALKKALKILKNKNAAWNNGWNAVFEERKRLIEAHPAYKEAAWRMTIGQEIRDREAGVFDIYDNWTQDYVPLYVPSIPSAKAEIEGVALEPGDSVFLSHQQPMGGLSNGPHRVSKTEPAETPKEEPVKSKHDNGLTREQRRVIGARGAEKRMDNRRRKEAREKQRYCLWGGGYTEGNQIKFIGHFSTMNGAFRSLTRHLRHGIVSFIVYDKKGKRWNYDRHTRSLLIAEDS